MTSEEQEVAEMVISDRFERMRNPWEGRELMNLVLFAPVMVAFMPCAVPFRFRNELVCVNVMSSKETFVKFGKESEEILCALTKILSTDFSFSVPAQKGRAGVSRSIIPPTETRDERFRLKS
jgi:hypothetical protein